MIARLFGKNKRAKERDGRPLVAVVDDEPDLCALLRAALENRGYAVATAFDGEAGLALIRQRRPSLIVLDIKMPKINGYQVLAQIQQDAELARIPVFVITSLDEEKEFSEEEWAKRLNVARFVAKPFDPETVAAAAAEVAPIGR